MDDIHQQREFMKSRFGLPESAASDQTQGLPQPPVQKAVDPATSPVDLPPVAAEALAKNDLLACLKGRRSRRVFTSKKPAKPGEAAPERKPLATAELSFLLWATQGVDKVVAGGYATLRPVPSAGARHPFETYLIVRRVAGLEEGIYRYLPLSHQLVFLARPEGLAEKLTRAAAGQGFVAEADAVFLWSCLPYRGEWRYRLSSHKAMLMDAGHVCQNLYLACEAVGCGTCGVAAYLQREMDELLGLDGEDEFVVYLAPVGKL